MIKDNLSRKLVCRCVAAAMALIITLAGASDMAGTSDPAISVQAAEQTCAQTVTTEVTDETVAYSMATYKASQGASSSVQGTSVTTSAAVKDTESQAAATTTTKTTSASAETTKAAAKSSAVTTTKAATTTTKAAVTAAATTTTTAATSAVTAPVNADADASLAKPVILPEQTFDTDSTHPWNHQTNQISIQWNAVAGASKYVVSIYGGQYTKWTDIATTGAVKYTASGLKRETQYSFAVKAIGEDGKVSEISAPVSIKTARMDYSAAGWQAMCRIVYHEVGGAAGSFWDKPIVYVADCVTNQYVCAKYTKQGVWPNYYKKYSNIESIIYTSGGFLSDAGLTARGATYAKVPQKVKLAVWGATYGVTYYKNIANDYNIFFWSSSGSAASGPKVGYSFKTPWGNYVNIWRQYWG